MISEAVKFVKLIFKYTFYQFYHLIILNSLSYRIILLIIRNIYINVFIIYIILLKILLLKILTRNHLL